MFGFPTEYKLPAGSDAQDDDFFGGSVGIGGDLAVVGALGQLGYNDGKVYIYKRGASGAAPREGIGGSRRVFRRDVVAALR